MARQISDEKLKLSIIIDGNPAQQELYALEKATRKYREENAALAIEKKKLEKAGQQESARYREITQQLRENTQAITANKARMSELQNEIGLTGLSLAQLRSKATALRAALAQMIPGSADFKRIDGELKQVQARINEVTGKAQQSRMTLSSLADGFNKYQALGASVLLMLTGWVVSIQKIIDLNGKLSDAQADVMKTTKMSKEEVDDLTKSFGLLQTRTSRIDLLKIAEEGGRIGIAKESIGDFVETMNMANVALGDSFSGGVEEVAAKLGKLKMLFDETNQMGVEESYNRIGSAINDLGADGVASEANIAEFATRIGSLPASLKPSIAETLALGAAFEESGIEAEVSARAYNIFLKQASTESAKFAKVMGLSQAQVEKMINDNPLEFFLKFSQGLKGMDATDIAKTLDYLGVNADGANKAIGAVANNQERFRELITVSNQSFAEGSSLIEEYNVKNNNLAATLDKISKTVSGWFSSEGFVNWLESVVNGFARFIGAAEDADGSAARWRNGLVNLAKIIAVVVAAMVTKVAWQKLVLLWDSRNIASNKLYILGVKARAFAESASMVVTQAWAAGTMLLRGNIIGATQALRAMTAAMATTPLGLLVALLAAVGTAYYMFSENSQKAATSQSILNDTIKEADGLMQKETSTLNSLLAVANDETLSREKRQKAMDKINELYPETLNNLTLENLKTKEGKALLDAHLVSMRKKLELQVLEARQKKLLEQIDEKNRAKLEEEVSWWDQYKAHIFSFGDVTEFADNLTDKATDRRKKGLEYLEKELKLTEEQIKKMLGSNPELIDEIAGGSTYNVPGDTTGGSGDTAAKKRADDQKRLMEAVKRLKDELHDLERKSIDDRLSLMKDGFEKEVALENENHARKIQDLQARLVSEAEMNSLDGAIGKATDSGDKKRLAYLTEQKELWLKKNAEINKQIEYEDQMHFLRLGTIVERQHERVIKERQSQYDREKRTREIAYNNELASIKSLEQAKDILRETLSLEELSKITTMEEARAALQKRFNDQEADEEKRHLETLIAEMEQMVKSVPFEGIDLNILTPEQRDKMQQQIEELRLLLAQLNAAKNGQANPEDQASKPKDLFGSGNTDILGFTPDQWDSFFTNLKNGHLGIQEMTFAVQALTSMWGQYNQFVTANEAAQLRQFERNSDARRRRLKRQLDNGEINQSQYKKAVEGLDQDLAKKKAEIEYKQAKRQKAMAAANVITSTAQAIIGIWAQFPKFDFGATAAIMSGVVGALGALQLANVLKTPLPAKGFQDGLYPDYITREQDGRTLKSQYRGSLKSGLFSRSSYMAVAENNQPEFVIDNRAWRNLDPGLRDALVRSLRGVRGWEDTSMPQGPSGTIQVSGQGSTSGSNSDVLLDKALAVIDRNNQIIEKFMTTPIVAQVTNRDLKSMKNLQDGLKDYEKLRNESRR